MYSEVEGKTHTITLVKIMGFFLYTLEKINFTINMFKRCVTRYDSRKRQNCAPVTVDM